MAPFWEKSKRIFKHNKKYDAQVGKPSELIAGLSDSNNTPKSDQVAHPTGAAGTEDQVAPPTIHSVPSAKQPLTTISPTPTSQASLPAPTVSSSQPTSSGSLTFISSSLRGPLWNQAYDGLKVKEPKLVDAYERILSLELSGGKCSSTDLEPPKNEIEQVNLETRRSQMMRLIQAGLDKTEKETAVKQGIEDGMQAVHSVKGIIDVEISTVHSLQYI
jgi:hypothetical protein